MPEVKITYGTPTTITIDLSSLASSSTFIAGRESTEIDNTTNKYDDAWVEGTVTVGTTPTADTSIVIFVWGANTSLATTAIDVLDGTDSAETLTNTGILGALKVGAIIVNRAATSNVVYNISPFSVASLFGGIMPRYWGLFAAHNTVAALNATNANKFQYIGITYTSA